MRSSTTWGVTLIGTAFLSLAIACSDSSTSSTNAPDGGSTSSTSSSSSGGAAGDSGTDATTALNGCAAFVDRSAEDAARNLQWDLGVGQRPERCMKIKVGQSLKLSQDGAFTPADLGAHPVGAAGGDTPSPFTDPGVDAAGNVLFEKAGSFGFHCTIHSNMNGVIQVVP
jgi:plastocyanin